jgi:hypothetical protein
MGERTRCNLFTVRQKEEDREKTGKQHTKIITVANLFVMGLQITLKLFLHFPSFPKISRASIRQKA